MSYWVFLDVDGTLREAPDVARPTPRPGLPEFFAALAQLDVKIVLWSAGGEPWAREAAAELGITQYLAAIHGKEINYRMYIGPKFFVDDWPHVLNHLIDPKERRFIVPTYYRIARFRDAWLAAAGNAIDAWRTNHEEAA